MNPQTEASATNPRSTARTMRLAIALTMVIAGTLLTVLPAAATPAANTDDPTYWSNLLGGQCWRHVENKNDNGHGSIKVDAQGHQYIELKTPPVNLVYRVLIIRGTATPVTEAVTEWATVGPAYYANGKVPILSWIVCKVSTASTTTTSSTTSTSTSTITSPSTSAPTTTATPTTVTPTTAAPTTLVPVTSTTEAPTVTLPEPPTTAPTIVPFLPGPTVPDLTTTTAATDGQVTTTETPTSVLGKTSTRAESRSSSTSLSRTRVEGATALAFTGGGSTSTAVGLGLLVLGSLLVILERRRSRA